MTTSGPRRPLTIHIGLQKTGSTSLHHHLQLNADVLERRMVLRMPVEGTPMRPLGRAAVEFSLNPDDMRRATLDQAIRVVREGLPDNGLPVLISHENLAGAMPGTGDERRLYPLLPRIMASLDAGFHDFSVDYVIYLRSQVNWLPSVWAQAVRTDGYTGTWADYDAEAVNLPEWPDLIGRLTDAIGADRLTVFHLEDETDPAHPGSQLLSHMGLSDQDIAALRPLERRAMERLSPASTEFMRRLNGLSLNPHARTRVADLVARTQHLFNADYRPSINYVSAEGKR
ncbi:MAG: hypothetical protein Q4G22_07035 [Paracoccus sp. (in: a-proteobacteria)]|uniref:hypothetical protein n=1 Tax=Paracoccus sp. TaxID=267 RepID=UPI0026DF0258|nr:hypothetical protein [Paracoccus sp. (in: a-proteobacteria)]MDO5631575.1 hypothetical protein [Paracoccus sp. (in: a-proteobacteria)]